MARAVLTEPRFAHRLVTTGIAARRTLLEMAWAWFDRHVLRPLLAPLLHALRATHGVGTDVGIALVILALVAVGLVTVRLVLAFGRPRGFAAANAEAALPARLDAAELRRRAREAAASGDFARAIAALWAAALALLDARQLVTFDPARTPGEYRRLVRRCSPRASEPFERLGERFVAAAYAPAAPLAADFARAERAFAEVEPAL